MKSCNSVPVRRSQLKSLSLRTATAVGSEIKSVVYGSISQQRRVRLAPRPSNFIQGFYSCYGTSRSVAVRHVWARTMSTVIGQEYVAKIASAICAYRASQELDSGSELSLIWMEVGLGYPWMVVIQ